MTKKKKKNEKGKRVVDTCKCMSLNDGLCMRFNLCKKGSTNSRVVREGETVVWSSDSQGLL